MTNKIIKNANKCYDAVVIILILLVLLFAGYCIWDNNQIYKDAAAMWEIDKDEVMSTDDVDISKYPRVIAWLNAEGTKIDYPVVQGSDNIEYLDKDFQGNYSVSGSIYLDSRNNRNFTDRNSVIYGHNMDKHMMFGDLKEYLDEDFFNKHDKVTVTLKNKDKTKYEYKVVAVVKVKDQESVILDPEKFSAQEFREYIINNAKYYRSDLLDKINDEHLISYFVSLVTCTSGHTYEKIALVVMRTEKQDVPPVINKPEDQTNSKPDKSDDTDSPSTGAENTSTSLLVMSVSALLILICCKKRRKECFYEKT